MSLASHVDKIRSLDSLLAEHEVIKREVSSLRELLEEEKRETEQIRGGRRQAQPRRQHHSEDEDGDLQSDDDDVRSIATVTGHELERVEEEDEEQLAVEEEERGHRRDELTRPRTPEPTGLGMDDEDYKSRSRSRSPSPPPPTTSQGAPSSSEDVNLRLAALSSQLESALELSRSLQSQHMTALSTISFLEAKVNALETLVHTSQAQAQSHVAEATQERASLTTLVNEWKKGVEGQWGGVQEEWAEERARLARAHDEWESRVNAVEKGLEGTIAKVDAGLITLEQQRLPLPHKQNGSARVGLVTPPSPRSLSSDSDSAGKSRRKKRSAASRGRSRSKDGSTSSSEAANVDGDGGSSSASVAAGCLPPNPNPRPRSPWLPEGDSDSDSHVPGRLKGHRRAEDGEKKAPPVNYPITPDASVRKFSSGSSIGLTSEEDAELMAKAGLSARPLDPVSYQSLVHMSSSRRVVFAGSLLCPIFTNPSGVNSCGCSCARRRSCRCCVASERVVNRSMPCPTIFILLFETFSLFFLFCIDVISLFLQYIMAVSFFLASTCHASSHLTTVSFHPRPSLSILLSFVRTASSALPRLATLISRPVTTMILFFRVFSILPHKRDVSIGKKGVIKSAIDLFVVIF